MVGDISPASNCIGDVPVFIDAEPGQASKLLPDYRVNSEQVSVLDFTGSSVVATQCNTTEALSCVIPEEGSDTSAQIDSVLDSTNDAYIYLSKEQMDNWLDSRKQGKETNNLRYVRISLKVNDGMRRSVELLVPQLSARACYWQAVFSCADVAVQVTRQIRWRQR